MHEDIPLNVFNSSVDRFQTRIDSLKKENRSLKKDIADLQDSMQFRSHKLDKKSDEIKSDHNNSDQGRYKKLTEKVAELEDRNRRNNIWLDGFLEQDGVESWEESADKLKTFIVKDFAIEEQVVTEKAHNS